MVVFTVTLLPEGPRWLLKKNRIEEARSVLAVLQDLPEDDPYIKANIDEINESLVLTGEGH